jgi:hypothetical protein
VLFGTHETRIDPSRNRLLTHASAKVIERCLDNGEDQEAEEAFMGHMTNRRINHRQFWTEPRRASGSSVQRERTEADWDTDKDGRESGLGLG